MENIPTNEANGKWRTKLQKWTKRAIILGVIYGLLWLFLPLSCAKMGMEWSNMNLGEHKTMKDVYHVNIGGITYAKDKFYILLRKPYLFNRYSGYIYSSKDLVNWAEEARNDFIPGASSVLLHESTNRYYIESNGHSIFVNSDVSDSYLPRQVGRNCYIISAPSGLFSLNCDGSWIKYTYLTQLEDKNKQFDNKENSVYGICKNIKNKFQNYRVIELEKFFCLPRIPIQNDFAYDGLNKIVQTNKLNILLDSSHTIYGDGKYVGIFYKNKQYYFIVSTDGIHYEIKSAPSELVSSLAINLFD